MKKNDKKSILKAICKVNCFIVGFKIIL